MSKFSIFTIFLSTTILVIVAELLVNHYLKYPQLQKELAANVAGQQSEMTQQQAVPSNSTQQVKKSAETLTTEVVKSAGFSDAELAIVPFKGILFESLDLRDFQSVPVFQYALTQDNRSLALFNEFRADSHLMSQEVYGYLKERFSQVIGAVVNETNQFGENSFYINFLEKPNQAFLVVKLQNNVYALTYQKEYHKLIKQLLLLI